MQISLNVIKTKTTKNKLSNPSDQIVKILPIASSHIDNCLEFKIIVNVNSLKYYEPDLLLTHLKCHSIMLKHKT